MPDVRGRTVAVVGSAGYLDTSWLGAEIDSADVVVRINWVLPIDPAYHAHVGARTDLVYHCRVKCRREMVRAALEEVPSREVSWDVSDELAATIPARLRRGATWRVQTGPTCIFEMLREGAAEVRVYGIDFYRSGWSQAKEQPRVDPGEVRFPFRQKKRPQHFPELDQLLLARLLDTEPRFRPDDRLRSILEGAHAHAVAR